MGLGGKIGKIEINVMPQEMSGKQMTNGNDGTV